MKTIDITGHTFSRWTVVERAENSPKGQSCWLCRCECGAEKILGSILLHRGISRSCGCLKRELTIARSTKHGHSSSTRITPTYHSWSGMVARCANPNNDHYANYGGRGITVCERWLSFANFLDDMGEKPHGMSIDREDTSGNYNKDNCRWATPRQQGQNKRNNRLVTHSGETLTISEWGRRLGINPSSLSDRLYRGWTEADALTVPIGTPAAKARCLKLEFQGEECTVAEWAHRLGVNVSVIYNRLGKGWTIERTLSTPKRQREA